MVATNELGFRLGSRSSARADSDTKTSINSMQSAMLAVLGLLLGFSVSMAVSRFDARRLLVLEEANAIGTTYWRTQFAPAPEGPEMANLLREYVGTRLAFGSARPNTENMRRVREEASRLQTELWSRAKIFADKDPRSVTAGLLLESLNQTFDLESARWAALNAHVPPTVIWVDGLTALLTASFVGYSFGLGGRRNFFTTWWLIVCVTLILAVIIDLDTPRKGLIRVSQQPMIDLQQQLRLPTR
jgi:hypothetical protein